MTAAVFDTNVVVSGVLSPAGPPGRILDAILDGLCRPVVTDRILAEYEEVLCRPRFRLDNARVRTLLDALRARALIAPFTPFKNAHALPDPDDAIFLEAAAALGVPIVTGNIKHFPHKSTGGISILSPAAFVARLMG